MSALESMKVGRDYWFKVAIDNERRIAELEEENRKLTQKLAELSLLKQSAS